MPRIAWALAVALLAILPVAYDVAEAATCAALQRELRGLQRGSGGGGRYDRAYREQASVLLQTDRRARRANCFGGGLFQRRSPECRILIPKLNEMQRNLARLDRMRRQSGGGGGGNIRRARQIQRTLAAGDCTPSTRQELRAARERPILRERRETVREAPQSRPRRGTFRTLCVRTCDGYYFPISFSTTRDRFGDDAQSCSAMCGGTEAQLFVHPNPGGGPEDMVSVDGQPYSDLPTAFQYRTNLNPSCSCKPAGGYSIIASASSGQPQAAQSRPDKPAPLIPRARPAPGEDPETLANRIGGLTPQAEPASPAAATVAGPTAPDGAPVRIVGPAYWGAPEQEGVVLTPVPN